MYEIFIDISTQKFKQWSTIVEDFKYDSSIPYSQILVDTTETAKYKYLLTLMNRRGHNVLVMGETGVGKSVIVNGYLSKLSSDEFVSMFMSFSAQTSSGNIQDIFAEKLVQRGRDLGPPSGKKMIFFIDDINMPK